MKLFKITYSPHSLDFFTKRVNRMHRLMVKSGQSYQFESDWIRNKGMGVKVNKF